MTAPKRVRVGQIVAPHGVRGEVRVLMLTDFPERWTTLAQVFVGEEQVQRGVKCRGFVRGGMPILAIAGVGDRDAAEALRGQFLSVPGTSVQPLPPDTYYWWQLEGLRAVAEDGAPIGTVVRVENNPANDILIIAAPDGRSGRVPMVRAFVRTVDVAAGTITLSLIPGMLE